MTRGWVYVPCNRENGALVRLVHIEPYPTMLEATARERR
jgi:hypothetical protein